MSFTAGELTQLGYIALDHYLKNKPIDEIAQERPFLAKLMSKKKSFPGGKQFITEQVRFQYDSNFQWYEGDDTVTYNRKDTVRQTQFPWAGAHDGFSLNEDLLLANGITLTDNAGPSTNSGAEMAQLTNLFEENIETLRLGFEESLDYDMHLDGTQNGKSIAGMDLLISLDPTTGTVGGINRATSNWWRNNRQTDIAGNELINSMETMWRDCTLNGGRPDYIMAGAEFIDTFRDVAKDEIARYTTLKTSGGNAQLDPSIEAAATSTGLHFQGVPIVWDPTFEILDNGSAGSSADTSYGSRCYFINTKHITLRPAAGHDMVARKPERQHNNYTWYWGLTFKGALTMNRANCHGLINVA